MSSLRQPVISGVVHRSRSVFCTPSLAIFPHTVINWCKSCEFGSHSWVGINFGVTFSDNTVVARARWTFQVSQGSVETLFRWGRKRLHKFRKKPFTKFHQNRPSFIEVITKKNNVVSFFLDTVYNSNADTLLRPWPFMYTCIYLSAAPSCSASEACACERSCSSTVVCCFFHRTALMQGAL